MATVSQSVSKPTIGKNRGPLVSIIIPTFNRAEMLERALRSCLSQTYRNIELIVVDDGSTDSTQDVVCGVASTDARVRLISQQNQKLPRALNSGHRAAKGEYLTWTSDDNSYDPEAIEIMAGYLDEHPEIGLVYCDFRKVDEKNRDLGVHKLPEPDCPIECLRFGACFLYRRQAFLAAGEYDPAMYLAEDYDFWVRVRKVCKIAHLAGVCPYVYAYHSASLTATRKARIELQVMKVLAKHANNRKEARTLLSSAYFEAAYAYRCQRQFGVAAVNLLRGLRYGLFDRRHYRCLFGLCLEVLRLKKNRPLA